MGFVQQEELCPLWNSEPAVPGMKAGEVEIGIVESDGEFNGDLFGADGDEIKNVF